MAKKDNSKKDYGKEVECLGYLKKQVKLYCLPNCEIENYTPEQLKVIVSTDESRIHYLSLGEEISQKEYELVNKKFDGILIGYKKVHLKKYYTNLGSDLGYGDDLQQAITTYKKKSDIVNVAKVSYGINKTRLVPIDKIVVKGE